MSDQDYDGDHLQCGEREGVSNPVWKYPWNKFTSFAIIRSSMVITAVTCAQKKRANHR